MLGQIAAQILITLVIAVPAGIGFRLGWKLVDYFSS